jgi:hypothetical protein
MRKPEQELAEIKSMMEQSTRFLSLSGLSGVLAGIYAIIGSGIAWYWIYFPLSAWGNPSNELSDSELIWRILGLALAILALALVSAWTMSKTKSKKTSQKFWTSASKRFWQALFIPVFLGGLFSFALVHEHTFQLIPAAMLCFYGLGLVSASHFTLGEIKKLGFTQLVFGVLAAFFPQFGLLFWAGGFGITHVIYGSMMHYKYDR